MEGSTTLLRHAHSHTPCCSTFIPSRRPRRTFNSRSHLVPTPCGLTKHTIRCTSETGAGSPSGETADDRSESSPQATPPRNLDKEFAKFARGTATTFAPRPSGPSKNPAYKGSVLYTVFEVQAWLSLAAGGLLSYNVIFPTDKPSIARLLGMWSIWMLTIPSLRARDCSPQEKEALNILFILLPLINITLPFVWKSFPFIFTADCVTLAAVYAWKMGLPKLGGEPQ